MKPRVFLDTNILLDLLLERPGFEEAALILQKGCDGEFSMHCSYLTIANIAFILRKTIGAALLTPTLIQICSLIDVLPMDKEQLEESWALNGPDMEDVLQAVCAAEGGCDCIVTRNPKDFKITPIPGMDAVRIPAVISPSDLPGFVEEAHKD